MPKKSKKGSEAESTTVQGPADWQILREIIRAYARFDAPIRMPAADEYQGPSVQMIVKAFPGQIVSRIGVPPWVWARDPSTDRPAELNEASRLYGEAGGDIPGPVMWFQDILTAKRGHPFRFSPFTTLYVPIDLFANIARQIGESKAFCEAARRKLIEITRQKPQLKGHEEGLAENILIVVLRKWKGESIAAIAQRFYHSGEEEFRRLTTRRIHKTHLLLKAHAQGYDPPARRTRPRK